MPNNSSSKSSSSGLSSLLSAYAPSSNSSSNFTPKSNGGSDSGGGYYPSPTASMEANTNRAMQEAAKANPYTPETAANLGLGYGAGAAQQAETQFNNAFGKAAQFAGGQNDPFSMANWTRNTSSLNATLAQQATDTLNRARDAALSKMQFRQQRRETEQTNKTARSTAATQAAAQVEAARTTAAATIEAAKQQALASRLNAQTSLLGSLISPMVSGIINVGDIKSNY